MFNLALGRMGRVGNITGIQRAIALLRSLGTSAHVWLPGASGVSVASLPSNNYLLSDFATLAGVDAVVGGVKDALNPSGGVSLTQATTANKPLVRRGILNQITYSNDLTNAAWLDYRSCTVSGQAIVEAAATASHFIQRVTAVAITSGVVYTTAYLVKANGRNFFAAIGDAAGGLLGGACRWNVSTGVNTVTGAASTVSSADAGSGYWLCTITATATGATAKPGFGPCLDGTTTPLGFQSYLGDGASGVLVAAVGIMAGSWTAAQILAEGGIPTTTATAASNPSAGKYWWSFDGSNDSLLSGNLGITNACTIVIAGMVNSLSAALQVFLSEDTNGAAFYVNANGSVDFSKTGVAQVVATAANVIVAGVPFVITARLSSGTAVIRKNGVQVATAATGLTFSATTGARVGTSFNGTSNPLGGALGWVVPIAAALSDADCLTVERLVGSQFPGMSTVDGDALALLLEDGSGFLTMETGDLLLLE